MFLSNATASLQLDLVEGRKLSGLKAKVAFHWIIKQSGLKGRSFAHWLIG